MPFHKEHEFIHNTWLAWSLSSHNPLLSRVASVGLGHPLVLDWLAHRHFGCNMATYLMHINLNPMDRNEEWFFFSENRPHQDDKFARNPLFLSRAQVRLLPRSICVQCSFDDDSNPLSRRQAHARWRSFCSDDIRKGKI